MKKDHAQRMLESLDNPIWFALTTEHRLLARSNGLARRYPPDVSPLAALLHPTNEAFADLQGLVSPGEDVALFTASPLDVPGDWQVDRSRWIDQMICEASLFLPPVAPLPLGTTDVPEMLELTAATEPGPFLPQTIQMGSYVGIRASDGRLVAMAGERLQSTAFAEISGVCTHPEFRGRGYARDLTTFLAAQILAAGKTPFLHVKSENGAKVLYHKIGFRLRAAICLTVISPRQSVPISRRAVLVGGTAVGASLLLGRIAGAAGLGGAESHVLKEHYIATNGISLHVTEQGEGPAVLFCHGFPDTSYTWRRQMKAVAAAGFRAIAPDMRGYGRSSAPADANLYTPLHTAGDLVGLLDALNVSSAVIVGHDWGAAHAWNAALMRPDRFKAVLGISVPYVPRGGVSTFERMRKTGHQDDFYMFEQIRPDADHIWADAAVTIPGILYWASGSAPADTRWSPMDPARSLHRPAPGPLPSWAEADYVAHNVAEFQRTGFHGALNYYRAAEPYFYLSGAWKGAKITQPSFYIAGKADGLGELYPPFEKLRASLPGLVGNLEIDNVGHWVQHEASAEVSEQIVKFVRTVSGAHKLS